MERKPDANENEERKKRRCTIRRIKDAKKEEKITKVKRYNGKRKDERRMQNKVEADNRTKRKRNAEQS